MQSWYLWQQQFLFGVLTLIEKQEEDMPIYVFRKDFMKITIITVGKLKEKYLKDAVAEYSKQRKIL